MTLKLRPLGDTLGMEALDVDLARPADAAIMGAIEAAFAAHPVLVFRNQRLDAARLLDFARHFGAPQPHILKKYRHPDFAEVSYITNAAEDGGIDPVGNHRATSWHSDETYNEKLPRLAMLHALEVPSARGGTIFVDMRAVFMALPEPTRRRLAPLTGTHRWLAGPARAWTDYRMTEAQAKAREIPPRRFDPPDQRPADPVRQSEPLDRFCRHAA